MPDRTITSVVLQTHSFVLSWSLDALHWYKPEKAREDLSLKVCLQNVQQLIYSLSILIVFKSKLTFYDDAHTTRVSTLEKWASNA